MTSLADRAAAVRLAWAVLKLSKAGRHPVAISRLAAAVGLEPDEARRLAGMSGFTVKGDLVRLDPAPGTMTGALHSDAVGVFMLAIATGERAHHVYTCPVTGVRIRVDVTPKMVRLVDPPSAVIAITDLNLDYHRQESVFFASKEAAEDWIARNPGGRVYPVADYLLHAHHFVALLEGRH
ncbi:MAG TPA: organomercurial lyase [Amycolatopsis sp.]|nr:organomercurial lyase [Amycolatopsis sp.]